ncbi:protein kinase [Modestobacter sp. I12A-02662]|uniref:serine/threonine-protein kinase n=1 Tax=Modestobacter sp. I12A-02662 TaxID=1730496 RepID=UPI0034DEA22D
MTTQQPGTVIAGYRIESLIGRGGMAVVYRAEDMRLGRKVALKLLSPQLADNEQFRQRFIRESRLAASLDHPNIVPIFEAGEAGEQLFIAMRYVVGSDLKGVLAEEGGRLPEGRTLRLFSQIADALDSAHRAGLVHRDVKPGNILVAAGSDRPRRARDDHVYLTDFGLTKRTTELSGGLTGTGHFLGTVDFVSPEQIQGRPVGPGTDIYALGCVLYECLTGQLPFRRDDDAALLWAHLVEMPPPVTGVRPELPPAVNAVVARAMAKDPADRFASCQEFLRALELALDLPAPVSSRVSPWSPDGSIAPRPGDAVPDEPGTVTGDVVGGSQHPSFPSGTGLRFPPPTESRRPIPPPADPGTDLGGHPDPDLDDPPGYDDEDVGPDWDDGGPAPPASVPVWRRHGRLIAIVAAAVLVISVAAVALLRSSLFQEEYRTYTSSQTVVPFRLDHPTGWGTLVSPASDIVLGPDPTAAGDLFFSRGDPTAWARAGEALRSGSTEDVWLYVYASSATYDTSGTEQLQESIRLLLPAATEFDSVHRDVSVSGSPADELEAVTSDPQNAQSRLRVLIDVVQPPGAGGAVLLAFFAPPDVFEDHRSTFERVRDSFQVTG